MNNFLISAFCGVIILTDIIAAHFGWLLARRRKLITGLGCLVLVIFFYRTALNMSFEAMLQIGAVNVSLAKTLLLVPIIIATIVSAITYWLEKNNINLF